MTAADTKTIVFALVLGVSCALLLCGAELVLGPYVRANEKAQKIRNVLYAVGADVDKDTTAEELLEVFERDVRVKDNGTLTFFQYFPDSGAASPSVVAALFNGSGLWGPIEGVMALDPDLKTIRRIRFIHQEETPGLGGEIDTPDFRDQFEGKLLIDEDGKAGFRIEKEGTPDGPNRVDAITGATMTSDRLAAIIEKLAIDVAAERTSE